MEKSKKFLRTDMTWLKTIILSLVCAVVVAVLNLIPAFKDSSLTAPAETLEFWFLPALFIIMNCRSYKDASLKTFVFFLISQPLIYLIEVPFNSLGWELFKYYPYWAVATFLTIPGAALAYRMKKDDWVAAVILSVANLSIIINGVYRMNILIYNFPQYLIAIAYCLIIPFVLTFILLKNKKSRMISVILAVVFIIVGIIGRFVIFPSKSSTSMDLESAGWSVESVSDSGLEAEVDGEILNMNTYAAGEYQLVLVNEDGEKVYYEITVSGASMSMEINEVDADGKVIEETTAETTAE